MNDFAGVFGVLALWNLHVVFSLKGAISVGSNACAFHSVVSGQDPAVSFDLYDGVY